MKKLKDWNKFFLILASASIYLLSGISQAAITYGSIALLILGLFKVISTKNKNFIGIYFISFFVGFEIFLRLSRSGYFWEFGKYSVILLTLACIISEKKTHPFSKFFLLFILFLLPSITQLFDTNVTEPLRELVASGLSGPITLGLLSYYLYKKKIPQKNFLEVFFFQLLSFIPTLIFLIMNFRNLGEIEFSTGSNFALSGGFGPNQMSTALGYGILIIFLSNLSGGKFFKYSIVDWGLAGVLAVFGLFTFSRGGIISSVLSIGASIFALYLTKGSNSRFKKPKIILFSTTIVFLWAWNYSNEFTGGTLSNRYKQTAALDDKYAFTGRRTLLKMEWQMFLDNMTFGIGPGMTRSERHKYGWTAQHSSHTEFTRLLAEHGMFGVFAILILSLAIFNYYTTTKSKPDKIKFIGLVSYSLLTMTHSAMRLSIPAFCFALAFVITIPNLLPETHRPK